MWKGVDIWIDEEGGEVREAVPFVYEDSLVEGWKEMFPEFDGMTLSSWITLLNTPNLYIMGVIDTHGEQMRFCIVIKEGATTS